MDHLYSLLSTFVELISQRRPNRRVVPPVLAGLVAVTLVLGPTLLTAPDAMHAMDGMGVALAQSVGVYSPTPNPGCSPNSVPVGQANPPGSQLEPLAPIWCFNLNPPSAPGFASGANDWSDSFDEVAPYGRFQDGDYNYRVFDNVQNGGTAHTQHFTNNQHWMDDNSGGFQGGTMMRPNRSFVMENNSSGQPTIVVEHDFAAGITGYTDGSGGDIAWGEITITTAPTPYNSGTTDGLYAYGRFPGFDTFGCRIHALQKFTCSYEAARGGANGLDTFPCFEFSPDRLIEISGFEQCGNKHFGGDPGFGAPGQYFRTCNSATQEPDMNCRDRFRLELNRDGLTAYVNGALYFQDTGWPARNQIPATWGTASQPLYVYFSDWEDRPTAPAYRFHWDNMAINPHNPDGTFRAPTAAPNFCLGAPGNICPMSSTTPTNTPALATTPTDTPIAASATPTRTLVPATTTPTSTATITPTSTATRAATSTSAPNGGGGGGGKHSQPTATPTLTPIPTPSPTPTRTLTPTLTLTPAPARWIASASVFPAQPARGQTITITLNITASANATALVDEELYGPSPTWPKDNQQYLDGQTFQAQVARQFTFKYTIPSNAGAGLYAVNVGVFGVGWNGVLTYIQQAATYTLN